MTFEITFLELITVAIASGMIGYGLAFFQYFKPGEDDKDE